MRKTGLLLTALTIFLSACQLTAGLPAASKPIATAGVQVTLTPFQPAPGGQNDTPAPIPADYPPEGYGPANFPADVNPLTGLKLADPTLLERRPIIIKVSNLPRYVRPQWGLSLADIVYEYYTEEGTTRFTAIYYSKDAEKVGDIRSARFFDEHLMRMYKGIFAFGSGDERVRERLYTSQFADRLILEWQAQCPAMCRYEPNVHNFLLGNTKELSSYATRVGITNNRQNLDGMFFQLQVPGGRSAGPGDLGQTVFVRFSAAIYNRWVYDPASGRYLRYSEKDNDYTGGKNEVYEQLTDRLTSQPIAVDNLIIMLIPHKYYSKNPEMVEMTFQGSGVAYAFRDGQAYKLKWQRPAEDVVVYLTYEDGTRFPFKPGTSWFEVMGTSSVVEQKEQGWRFSHIFPP